VPATAFYEWGTVDNKKVKYLFTVADLRLFYMAALWKKVQTSDEQAHFHFTIITTEPNDEIKKIHNRMPAILTPQSAQKWINNDNLNIIKPYDGSLNYTL
jgi:putative SOS response-associated peptidase YedK